MKEYRSVRIVVLIALAIVTSANDYVKIPARCPSDVPVDTAIYLKHEHDCAKFYKCLRGKRTLMVCPYRDEYGNRLHFDPSRQICDWPDSKVCDDKWQRPSSACPENLRQCIRIAHETDCDKFYLCDRGRETIEKCATGLHFNPAIQMCDYPKNAGCEDSCGWTCCPPKGTHLKVRLSHECSCEKYYECTEDGDRILRRCSRKRGEHFDDRRRKCAPAEEAGCIVRTKMPPIDAITKCPRRDNIDRPVKLPHQCDCDLYYQCAGGEMILRKCRAGRNFNPRLGDCDIPENIPCDMSYCCSPKDIRGLPVLPDDPEEPKCPARGGTVKLPHAKNCSLYYVCQNGSRTVHACPSGLYFNPLINQCDWPFNVKCTARQAPPPSRPVASEDEERTEY